MSAKRPSLRSELALVAEGALLVAGADEVGRGALGGPVSAGVVVIDPAADRYPRGLRDSKLLTPPQREALVPRITSWASAAAVGHASAAEIDEIGILAALRLAGERALAALPELPDCVLLDGNYDWFRRPPVHPSSPLTVLVPRVELKVKADLLCASSAAASVLAKVERDRMMCSLAERYPGYGWAANKGYATPEHLAALRELGPCEEHRRSWRLQGSGVQLSFAVEGEDPADEEVEALRMIAEEAASEAASVPSPAAARL